MAGIAGEVAVGAIEREAGAAMVKMERCPAIGRVTGGTEGRALLVGELAAMDIVVAAGAVRG